MKTMLNFVAFGVLAIVMLVGGILVLRPSFAASIFHPEEAGIRMEVHQANKFVSNRAPQIENHTFKKKEQFTDTNGDIDPNKWFGVAMTAADNVRDDRRMRAAAIARAKDQDESVLSTEVPVYQDDWAAMPNDSATRTVREVRVPTLVTVTGIVSPEFYPEHRANPDGRIWEPAEHRRNRTVLMEERGLDQPTEQTGNLNEAIARFCQDKDGLNCGKGFAVGSRAVLCVGPGLRDGGFLQTRYNGLQRIDGVVMHLYFSGTEKSSGKFKVVITPDDPSKGQTFATDVCTQHPGYTVVKLPQAETLVATR